MPDYECTTSDVSSSDNCAQVAGLLGVGFLAKLSDVDLTALTIADNVLSAFALNTGGVLSEIKFEAENGRLDSLFTSANGYEDITIPNIQFLGGESENALKLDNMKNCCMVAFIPTASGKMRFIGLEHIDGAWVNALRKLKIGRKLDTTGALGSEDDKERTEIDLIGRQFYTPLFSSLTVTDLRAI